MAGDGVRIVASLFRLAWRNRAYLAPVYFAGALWLGAAMARAWLNLTVTVVLAAVALTAVRLWVWRALDRAIERLYALAVAGGAAGWLVAAVVLRPWQPVLVRVLLIGTLAGAVPWWTHRRVRARVRVERVIDAWPTLAERLGLTGSRLVSAVVTTWGWSGRLVLSAGQTARDVAIRLRQIESALRLPIGSVRAEPWQGRADVALLRVVENDPHAEAIEWQGRASGSIAAELEVGPYDDGELCRIPLYDQGTGTHHALVAGTNGSGKSGLLNLIASHAASAADAVIWAVDLKGGTELRPWWSVMDWLVTSTDDATRMLAALRRIVDRRGQDTPSRVWQVTSQAPVIVVLVDEAAELPAVAVADLESVARRGRALGVLLVLATQYPTVDAVVPGKSGASSVPGWRSASPARVCCRRPGPPDRARQRAPNAS